MTHLQKASIVASIIIGLTGCTDTSDITVKTETSNKVNFAAYKTYDFIQGNTVAHKTTSVKVINDQKINNEIATILTEELAKKGKTFTTVNPDLHIAYIAAKDADALNDQLNKEGQETVHQTKQGSMVLVAIDAHSKMIIGLATAEGTIKNSSHEERQKRITYAIKKMINPK